MADTQKDMIKAAKHGDLEKARSLLADDAGLLNACDTDGSTPLSHPVHVPSIYRPDSEPGAKRRAGHPRATVDATLMLARFSTLLLSQRPRRALDHVPWRRLTPLRGSLSPGIAYGAGDA